MAEITLQDLKTFQSFQTIINLVGERDVTVLMELPRLLKKDTNGYSYFNEIEERPVRSYAKDRVAQFLRHISRVLFFDVNEQDQSNGIVEVQVMLAKETDEIKKLYVSFNTKYEYEHNNYRITSIKNLLENILEGLYTKICKCSTQSGNGNFSKNRDYSLKKLKRHEERHGDCRKVLNLFKNYVGATGANADNSKIEILTPVPSQRMPRNIYATKLLS